MKPGEDITIDFPVLLLPWHPPRTLLLQRQKFRLKIAPTAKYGNNYPRHIESGSDPDPDLMVKGFSFFIDEEITRRTGGPADSRCHCHTPGDIGFLNQYFSVMLMVGNAALRLPG